MARPSIFPDWARTTVNDPTSGQPNVAAPSESRKDLGFGYKQRGPRQFFNWLFRTISAWVHYLDEQVTDLLTRMESAETGMATLDGRIDAIEAAYTVTTSYSGSCSLVIVDNSGNPFPIATEGTIDIQVTGDVITGTIGLGLNGELINDTSEAYLGIPAIRINDATIKALFFGRQKTGFLSSGNFIGLFSGGSNIHTFGGSCFMYYDKNTATAHDIISFAAQHNIEQPPSQLSSHLVESGQSVIFYGEKIHFTFL